MAQPLHRLLDKKATWTWGQAETTTVKRLLISDSILIQYNETIPLILTCDASPFGVRDVLSHQMPSRTEAPIAFYSRTLSMVEPNYSQLDREALSAVVGVQQLNKYLYGRDFELITDHKPLLDLLAGHHPTPTVLSP